MESSNGFFPLDECRLDPRWLIDPKLLFVGPKIGEGAHAKVYEGKWVASQFVASLCLFFLPYSFVDERLVVVGAVVCRYKNQNVAVKVMQKGDNPEEVAKREGRFMREVTMLARVQHKNLVKVVVANGAFW